MNLLDISFHSNLGLVEVVFQVDDPNRLKPLALIFSSVTYYYFDERCEFVTKDLNQQILKSVHRKNLSIRNAVFKASIGRNKVLSIEHIGKLSAFRSNTLNKNVSL